MVRPTLAGATLVLLLAAFQGTALAGDPYGSTTTTAGPPGQTPSCVLRTRSAAPGETATVRVHSVERGITIELRFDGDTVVEATADGPGESAHVNIDIDFMVPTSAEPGQHFVTAVSADVTLSCQTPNGEEFEVSEVQGASATADDRSSERLLLLLVIGLIFVLVARVVLAASRRRVPDVHGGTRRRL